MSDERPRSFNSLVEAMRAIREQRREVSTRIAARKNRRVVVQNLPLREV